MMRLGTKNFVFKLSLQENINLAPDVFEGWMVLHTWDESFEALIPGLSGIETYRLPWYSGIQPSLALTLLRTIRPV